MSTSLRSNGSSSRTTEWARYSRKQLRPVYLLVLKFPFGKNPVASHDRDLNYLRDSWLNKNSSSVVNTDEVTQDLGVAGGGGGGGRNVVSTLQVRKGRKGKSKREEMLDF